MRLMITSGEHSQDLLTWAEKGLQIVTGDVGGSFGGVDTRFGGGRLNKQTGGGQGGTAGGEGCVYIVCVPCSGLHVGTEVAYKGNVRAALVEGVRCREAHVQSVVLQVGADRPPRRFDLVHTCATILKEEILEYQAVGQRLCVGAGLCACVCANAGATACVPPPPVPPTPPQPALQPPLDSATARHLAPPPPASRSRTLPGAGGAPP